MDIVTKVLEEAAKQAQQFKSINVEKHLELEYDLGTLLAVDSNDLDLKQIRFVLLSRLWLYLHVMHK
jgi:regulator of ribosome biosynthesis